MPNIDTLIDSNSQITLNYETEKNMKNFLVHYRFQICLEPTKFPTRNPTAL